MTFSRFTDRHTFVHVVPIELERDGLVRENLLEFEWPVEWHRALNGPAEVGPEVPYIDAPWPTRVTGDDGSYALDLRLALDLVENCGDGYNWNDGENQLECMLAEAERAARWLSETREEAYRDE